MKRRRFLGLTSLLALPKVLFAGTNRSTPSQTEGPFYPVYTIPLRSDLLLNTQLVGGRAMALSGRVLDTAGIPFSDVKVEIWQCDATGLYDHPRQHNTERFDPHFSGSGAALTDAAGVYRFRTLYPVPYTGRPPHIHVKLWRGQQELLTTQLYLENQMGNAWFGNARAALQISPESDAQGELQASFDFVV